MSRILIVDDEPAIAELISINLRHAGFAVSVAADADEARRSVADALPDLVLLDWMLAGESGPAMTRHWRSQAGTRELPIIMVSARADDADKVLGLDAGVDDYVTKPFSLVELVARIRAVLRRREPAAVEAAIEIGPLTISPSTHRVTAHGREARLGATEFRLLHHLMTQPERVHDRSQLLSRVWGEHSRIETRTVDVHIKRLRDSLGQIDCDHMIETVRGAGYRLADPALPEASVRAVSSSGRRDAPASIRPGNPIEPALPRASP